MGKTRKVSKGHSSHFVPDYRHAVETMGEMERVRSLGRGDAEITASEGSCAPKRRCLTLNGENNHDASGVPVNVFSVSRMSHSEKIDLECRLRNELQHVRILQRRLASVGSNALPSPGSDIHSSVLQRRMASLGSNALPSPASEIRSSGGGIVRPALENLNRHVSEVAMLKGKKKPPQGRKVSGAKRPEPAKAAPSSTTVSMLMKQCETLIQRLMTQNVAYIFNEPVDIVKANIPDYFNIIKQPMDLGTIKSKLLSGQYSDPLGFASDVRLTFTNAMTYNPQGNAVHDMAKTLSKFFEVRWKPIEKKFSMMVDTLPSKPSSIIESETDTSKPPVKKMKVDNVEHEVKQTFIKRVMTLDEKQRLSAELEEVASELPDNIIDFLKGNTNNSSESNDDELEIDLDSLTDETLFILRDLLNNYLSNTHKGEEKMEPCEIELHNESMFSNSSVQPCRGNGLADEDVDIGGNDAPISSFPPLEIENDGAGQNVKYSSSSSSSSDSGSSSSDSDTGSAPVGDSGGIKNKTHVNEKETCSSVESLQQKGSCIAATATGAGNCDKDILIGDVQPNSEHNFDSGSVIGCQMGGGDASTERQVSPGNNARAAELRRRFAGTILKAKEKALEKDEKIDLDKLRLEREEFERTKKEDKARLLADARAAEMAHRKAEAEAAAKAKRKRELEREAARQALQKMEKTVDINENTQFLEDLEILRSAPEQSLLGVRSPDDDQNGLGSFNLQASSHPLEQLGLYMKDDDEEEEGDHHTNENTQSLVDLELLRSTPEQSLFGAASSDGNQNGIESYNLQARGNSLEQLGLYKKDDCEEEEEGEHYMSSPMETTNINENTQSPKDLEVLRSAPEQNLLGVTSPEDCQNSLGSSNLQVGSTTSRQLGLYKKDGDEEEEEGEHHIALQMETTTNINENNQPLKDLEILGSAPDQSLLEVTSPDHDPNGLGSFELQVRSNPLEQLGRNKNDGDEEEKVEHDISSHMETTVNLNESTPSLEDLEIRRSAPEHNLLGERSLEDDRNGLGSYNLQASNNSFEQLGLRKKDDDEEEGDERHISSQMEMEVDINENTQPQEDLEILRSSPEQSLLGVTSPEDDPNDLGSCSLQASSNCLEKLEPYKKDNEEEGGEHHISSQMETTADINENTQPQEDLEIARSAPEQNLLGVTSSEDNQNGFRSCNLQASTNSLEKLEPYKNKGGGEEGSEHHISSQMETTADISDNTRPQEDLEIPRSAPEQSLLGATSPEDNQDGLGSRNIQASSNSVEQLDPHKKYGGEDEESEHHISSQMETTADINENYQRPEDLETLISAPEQSLLGVTSPEEDQNGLGCCNLQTTNNSLEQLELYKKDNDEEELGEHHSPSQLDTTADINENTQPQENLEKLRSAPEQNLLGVTSPEDDQNGPGSNNLQASSNSLEQLGLYKKDGDEEEEGEHLNSSQLETTIKINEITQPLKDLEILRSAPDQSLLKVASRNDDHTALGSCNLQASGNSLEQLGLYMKDDDEEGEAEP